MTIRLFQTSVVPVFLVRHLCLLLVSTVDDSIQMVKHPQGYQRRQPVVAFLNRRAMVTVEHFDQLHCGMG